MFLVLFCGQAADAATIRLAWDASPDADVAGYIVVYGTASGSYTASMDVGKQLSCDVQGLADGRTYYFAVKAYTAGP